MKLTKRLLSLASLVASDDQIADIGCDHAYLDIYLIKNKIVNKTLASDVNELALNNGINNIKKYHLESQIKTKLGDGIETITEDINTLIISGMGASTINKILDSPKINQINKMIIQSNNDHYLLRKTICAKGFYISHESVIQDSGRWYINIVFLKGSKKYTTKELTYGPILMHSNKEYFKYLYAKEANIIDNIPKHKIATRTKLNKELHELKNIIK